MKHAVPVLSDEDAQLVAGVRAREIRALAKAITLIESNRADHRVRAQQIVNRLLPETGHVMRIGLQCAM